MTRRMHGRSNDPYEEHRAAVLAVLARRCHWVDPTDREALFHDAYTVFLEKRRDGSLEAMETVQVRAYLIQTALFKALAEGRRAGRRRTTGLDDAIAVEQPELPLEERIGDLMDAQRLREIVTELPERQQTIIKLRYFFDRTPAEIQRYVGISERVYRRELERALKRIAAGYELVREGQYCESRSDLIAAYVAGLTDRAASLVARRHLASCPGCAHWAGELRGATRGAAAVLPLPVLATGGGAPFRDFWMAIRDGAERVIDAGRQQLASWAAHLDAALPQAVAAGRPGTVGAALLSCVALGGGAATYCVSNAGLPNPFAAHEPQAQARKPAPPRPAAPRRAASRPKPRATATPVATTRPTRATDARRASRKRVRNDRVAPTRTVTKTQASAPPDDEFGFERTTPAAASPPARTAAPRQSSAPGEFDP